MITDQRRLQNSAAIAAGFHGFFVGAYFFLLRSQQQTQLVLTQVEFLDLKPQASPIGGSEPPAQQTPRSVRDFLKMALPSFHPFRSRDESAMKEAAPREESFHALDQPKQSIHLDNKRLERAREPSFRSVLPQRSQGPLSDLAERPKAPRAEDMAMPKSAPDISLEAVGRRAQEPESNFINLNAKREAAGSGELADLADRSRPQSASAPLGAPSSEIHLKEASSGKAGGGTFSSLSYGYSRGGSISLQERPAALAGGSLALAKASPKVRRREMAFKSASVPKAVEISGPLAKRKIASFFVPPYPDWAKEQGVEAEVVVRFFVSPAGEVRRRMMIEKTSGYPELDDLAMSALKKWSFAPLDSSAGQEDQWGLITFRFKLR